MIKKYIIILVFGVVFCQSNSDAGEFNNTLISDYETEEFVYYYFENPHSQINLNDFHNYYLQNINSPIIGIWTSDKLEIDIGIIEYSHLSKAKEQFQYLIIITNSTHKRFKYFEYFGSVNKTANDNVYDGHIIPLNRKILSPENAIDTVLTFFGKHQIGKNSSLSEFLLNLQAAKSFYYQSNFYLDDDILRINAIPNVPISERHKFNEEQTIIEFERKHTGGIDINNQSISSGSGFIITDKVICTAFHIVNNKEKIIIINSENDSLRGEIIVRDSINDIALIKTKLPIIKNNFQLPYALENNNYLKAGSTVYTIGYPLGEILGNHGRISEGIVNSLYGVDDDPRIIQISNPVQPGNSGGILLDKQTGNVVGMVVSGLSTTYFYRELNTVPQNVNFAVKSQYLNILIETAGINMDNHSIKNQLGNKELNQQFEIVSPYIVKVLGY